MILICDVDLFKTLRHWGALGTKRQDAIIIYNVYRQFIAIKEKVNRSDLPDSGVMTETTSLNGLSSPSVEACRWKLYLVTGVRSLAM